VSRAPLDCLECLRSVDFDISLGEHFKASLPRNKLI